MIESDETLALDSIAEVITEARALVMPDRAADYNQALVDITMQRIKPDVAFLILDVREEVEAPTGEADNGKAPRAWWYIIDHPKPHSVVHASKNCPRLATALGYHKASSQDIATRTACRRCSR